MQSGSWVASDPTVDVDSAWGGSKSFFSGEGLLLLRCSGHGDLLIASYGAIRDYDPNGGARRRSTPVTWWPSTTQSVTPFVNRGLEVDAAGWGRAGDGLHRARATVAADAE